MSGGQIALGLAIDQRSITKRTRCLGLLSADEPSPERRDAGVQSGVPVLVPARHLGIFFEALREFIDAESLVYRKIGLVRWPTNLAVGW
jgi:hypothetical protein